MDRATRRARPPEPAGQDGAVSEIVLEPVRPDSEIGMTALRRYVTDLVQRWEGRLPDDVEADAHLLGSPAEHLVPPAGVFVVAVQTDTPDRAVGCAGLRCSGEDLPPGAGEVKRMWVDPATRGHGLGTRMLAYLTDLAREAGLRRLLLDTRSDLDEARRLYERNGFTEVDPYNDNPHAQHWYAKDLW
jgi:ribosomal protein S18 acetylase RimI-like enzyme